MRRVCGGPWMNQYLKTSRKVRIFATDLDMFHEHLDQLIDNIPKFTEIHRRWRRVLYHRIKVIKGQRAGLANLQQADPNPLKQQTRTGAIERADQVVANKKLMLRGIRVILRDLAKIKRKFLRLRRRHHHRCRQHHRRHHNHRRQHHRRNHQ
jgi:hypothetical protein